MRRPRDLKRQRTDDGDQRIQDENPDDDMQQGRSSADIANMPGYIGRPREERPYSEFVPDLRPNQQMKIRWQPEIESDDDLLLFASVNNNHMKSSSPGIILSSLSRIVNGVVNKINRLRQSSDSELEADSAQNTPNPGSRDDGGEGFECLKEVKKIIAGPVLFPKYPAAKIPMASFEKISDTDIAVDTKHELPSRHYIRYVEPFEEELRDRVEYDMDEQDKCWLKMINQKRAIDGTSEIAHATFELLVDRLEKGWFNLTKDIHRSHQEPLSYEESVCNICNDGECENTNAIVFCDGCNLAVHQECYGVPYIPEGQWLCRKCMLAPGAKVRCIFCPNEGGALKQTTANGWAHLLCALWIPEVNIANPIYMEPVEGVEKIPKGRWRLICSICHKRNGACIQCHKSNCFAAFHVTCARKAGLYMKIKHYTVDGLEHTSHKAFCEKHCPVSPAGRRSKMVTESDDESDSEWETDAQERHGDLAVGKRHADSDAKQRNVFAVTTVVAPHRLLENLCNSPTTKYSRNFLVPLVKYWSIKRQFRRGAPLLKRLHLEPWTAFSTEIKQSEALKLARFKTLSHLRNELETIRILCDLVKRREREKLRKYQSQIDLIYMPLFSLDCVLRRLLETIRRMDRLMFFAEPVKQEDVPDYYDVVKVPMDLSRIQQKINDFQYSNLREFEDDARLICTNALLYNKPGTVYARTALKISEAISLLIINAETALNSLDFKHPNFFGLISVDSAQKKEAKNQTKGRFPIKHGRQRKSVSHRIPSNIIPEIDDNIEKIVKKLQDKYDQRKVTDDSEFSGGDLVWAKLTGFPWFPAEIVDRNNELVPDAVRLKQETNSFLGRFFDRDLDENRSWLWVTSEKLQKFDFADKDAIFIEHALKKSPSMRRQVIIAYIVGCKSRGIDPNSVFRKTKLL